MITIDQTNFYRNTKCLFTPCDKPAGEPSYVSKQPWGEVSSFYYYTNEGVIRVSNHWGTVSSCLWNLKGINTEPMGKCVKTEWLAGFITFEELTNNHKLSYQIMTASTDDERSELIAKLHSKLI